MVVVISEDDEWVTHGCIRTPDSVLNIHPGGDSEPHVRDDQAVQVDEVRVDIVKEDDIVRNTNTQFGNSVIVGALVEYTNTSGVQDIVSVADSTLGAVEADGAVVHHAVEAGVVAGGVVLGGRALLAGVVCFACGVDACQVVLEGVVVFERSSGQWVFLVE